MKKIDQKHFSVDPSGMILESFADGVFTVDRDFTITFFNRAAEKITGVSRQIAVGKKCYEVFKTKICRTGCILKRSIETGKDGAHARINILSSKGKVVPISLTTSVLRDSDGEIIGGVQTFRDISAIETRRKEISRQYVFEDIISKNYRIQQIISTLPDIAKSKSTVLLEGPSGSGKELFARAVHKLSKRPGKFIALNCAALPDTLLESELFGYREGAFTGANTNKKGRFALAEKGSIFLDEIGDISPALQLRLLRVLQEREYEPLGSTTTIKTDVRVVAATNKYLKDLVDKGLFRDDLYFRLNVIKISLPPLSEHREDIPLLAEHFVLKFNELKQKSIELISPAALNLLMSYDYPGNIRELENIIEYSFVLCHTNQIDVNHLPLEFIEALNSDSSYPVAIPTPLDSAEAQVITNALHNFDGSRTSTAKFLGIEKTTLWRKMKKLGIKCPLDKLRNKIKQT
jgi:PAS domain S-box-containing protein